MDYYFSLLVVIHFSLIHTYLLYLRVIDAFFTPIYSRDSSRAS